MSRRNFIHNCKNLEAAKMSFNKQIKEQNVVYAYRGVCSERKRNELSCEEMLSKYIKCTLLSEKSQYKKAAVYASKHMTF